MTHQYVKAIEREASLQSDQIQRSNSIKRRKIATTGSWKQFRWNSVRPDKRAGCKVSPWIDLRVDLGINQTTTWQYRIKTLYPRLSLTRPAKMFNTDGKKTYLECAARTDCIISHTATDKKQIQRSSHSCGSGPNHTLTHSILLTAGQSITIKHA